LYILRSAAYTISGKTIKYVEKKKHVKAWFRVMGVAVGGIRRLWRARE